MFKNYLKWQIKSLLPLGLILLVVMGTTFISTCMTSDIFTLHYIDYGYYDFYYFLEGRTTNLLTILIPAFIISNIFPFWVFNYRYSLVSADTFYQAPMKEGTVRKTRLLICLIFLLVDFTVVFWMGYSILGLRQLITPLPEATDYYTYSLDLFRFDFIFYAYLASILLLAVQYFIAGFFVSRGNSFVNSLFLLLIGEAGLALIFETPLLYLSDAADLISTDYYSSVTGLVNLSIISPIVWIYRVFNNGILNGEITFELLFNTQSEKFFSTSAIIIGILYIVIGIVCAIVCYFEKDPSGEYAGKPICRDCSQDLIFNISFGLIGTVMFTIGSLLLGGIISLTFWALGYYLFSGLLNRDFRLKGSRLFIMLGMITLLILEIILASILSDISSIDIVTA